MCFCAVDGSRNRPICGVYIAVWIKDVIILVNEDNSSIQVLDRAFLLIDILSNCHEKLSLAELSCRSGIAKSTAFRILRSLRSLGYVEQNSYGQYYLTFKICGISRRVLDKTDIISIAQPHLKRLCASVRQTINLVVREGTDTVYVARQEDASAPFHMTSVIGTRRPLHVSAVGKCILAGMSDEQVSAYWSSIKKVRLTPYTITTLAPLLSEIKKIRDTGYAIDNQENTLGVRCIAAGISNFNGEPSYAISISCPIEILTDTKIDEFAPFLVSTSASISNALGSS